VQQFVLQEHPGLARLVRIQLARGGSLAQRGGRHMKKLGGFVQAYCRIINDHDQPCGSGRLETSCHSMQIIADIRKTFSVGIAGK